MFVSNFTKIDTRLVDKFLRVQTVHVCLWIVNKEELAEILGVKTYAILSIDVVSEEFSQIDAKCKHGSLKLKLLLDDNGSLSLLLSLLAGHQVTDSHDVLQFFDITLSLPAVFQKIICVIW